MPTTKRGDPKYRGVEITMLPISAGDATLVTWGDGPSRHTVLIDAGLRETEAIAYLQSIGIFHFDLIILSHPDMDHLGGLLAIMESRTMSVDRIWCFDLNFLRHFITTGRIPAPQPATREVVYAFALRSTLDQFSDILTSASGQDVQVLQVSEGYRLALWGVLLEVLYPPESFYRALSSPAAITELLVARKWPEQWTDEREGREDPKGKARPLSRQERKKCLTEMVERPEMPEEGVHLSDFDLEDEQRDSQREREELGDEEKERGRDTDILPWKMVGTLYNNLSIVVKLTVLGGINPPSILFPGDLTDWTTLIARNWGRLSVDVLKMPHHGSKHIVFDPRPFHEPPFCDLYYWHMIRERAPFWWWHGPEPWSYDDLRRFERLVESGDARRFVEQVVRPSRILVFPHPQHKLPSMPMGAFRSNIIANRHDRDLRSLSSKDNIACPARLMMGLERGQLQEA